MEKQPKSSPDTYSIEMRCMNCDYVWYEGVPPGCRCDGLYLCPRCDCLDGRKAWSRIALQQFTAAKPVVG
jgi:hypothetical protein